MFFFLFPNFQGFSHTSTITKTPPLSPSHLHHHQDTSTITLTITPPPSRLYYHYHTSTITKTPPPSPSWHFQHHQNTFIQTRDESATTHSFLARVITQLSCALNRFPSLPSFLFKPKQVQIWDYLMHGRDVIGVLPTGFGKSILFQLQANILPMNVTGEPNICLVVSPLNSIKED